MSSLCAQESGNLTPRAEHVPLALSICGNGIATMVRGEPYVEITRTGQEGFDVLRLLALHDEKRIRRLQGQDVVTINDIIVCEYR